MDRFVSISGLVFVTAISAICQSRDGVSETPLAASLPPDSPPSGEGVKLLLAPSANPLRMDKRIFGVIPNHRATQDSADYKPLKTWEKFKLAERDTFDWPNFPLMMGFALQTQIAEKGLHGKAFGRNFAQYYGRTFADGIIGNYITEALVPSLLHEDPRFFRSGIGPVWKRAYKAARQVAVTRKEDGKPGFNFSEILGNTAVVAATSLYYPDARRLGPAATRVGLQIGNDVLSNLMTEFWPDVKRQIQHLRHRQPGN